MELSNPLATYGLTSDLVRRLPDAAVSEAAISLYRARARFYHGDLNTSGNDSMTALNDGHGAFTDNPGDTLEFLREYRRLSSADEAIEAAKSMSAKLSADINSLQHSITESVVARIGLSADRNLIYSGAFLFRLGDQRRIWDLNRREGEPEFQRQNQERLVAGDLLAKRGRTEREIQETLDKRLESGFNRTFNRQTAEFRARSELELLVGESGEIFEFSEGSKARTTGRFAIGVIYLGGRRYIEKHEIPFFFARFVPSNNIPFESMERRARFEAGLTAYCRERPEMVDFANQGQLPDSILKISASFIQARVNASPPGSVPGMLLSASGESHPEGTVEIEGLILKVRPLSSKKFNTMVNHGTR